MTRLHGLQRRATPRRLSSILPLGLMLIGLTACATDSATPSTDPFCVQDGPIYFDQSAVSDSTAAQIDRHNGVWVCLCENDCPEGS